MSTSHDSSDDPQTEAEFQESLVRLIRSAHDNDIDIEGGWMDRSRNPDAPDWGIEIYEVVKPRQTEELE